MLTLATTIMVNLFEFDKLSFSEKTDCTLIYGTYIMERVFRDYKTALYHLNDYFVEVLYNNMNNTIVGIASLPEKAVFQKYTDYISLKDLY